MTLEQAKAFYMQYDGKEFHMGREEPSKYQEYKNLNIPLSVLTEWENEVIEGYFSRLWDDKESVWVVFSRLIDKLCNCKQNAEKYLLRLLVEMEKMSDLDEINRILIIETMAGRTANFTTGGIYLYCTKTKVASKANEIVNQMIAQGAVNTPDRFQQAVSNYKKAYLKFMR